MAAFIAHPEQWQLLASEPALAAQAAEEVVRYCPSALLGLPRIAKTDVEVNGMQVAADACVLPITGSANRDESVFEAAGTLDITLTRAPQVPVGRAARHAVSLHQLIGAAVEGNQHIAGLAAFLKVMIEHDRRSAALQVTNLKSRNR